MESVFAHPTPSRETRSNGPRILFAWPDLQVGAFDCWPADERWRRENRIDEGHIIAIPGTAVEIAQLGHSAIVADPTRAVLYNRDQIYRRAIVDRSGDHCTFLVVAPAVLEELASSGDATVDDPDRSPFSEPVSSLSVADHLEHRSLLRLIAAADTTRTLELQERLVLLVGRILQRERRPSTGRLSPRRAATEREHERIVEAARAVLATDLARPISLNEVAASTGASVFHLSRVFRERAGSSLHAYREQLRLRSAIEWVLYGGRRLADVSVDLGFASHSHFTDRFRAAYGVAPTELRSRIR